MVPFDSQQNSQLTSYLCSYAQCYEASEVEAFIFLLQSSIVDQRTKISMMNLPASMIEDGLTSRSGDTSSYWIGNFRYVNSFKDTFAEHFADLQKADSCGQ